MATTASPVMKHAVITASSPCKTMVGARVGTPTQPELSIIRLMMGSVEVFVLVKMNYVELVGAMLCTALVWPSHSKAIRTRTLVALEMIVSVTCSKARCSTVTILSHAMRRVTSMTFLPCRTVAGVCAAMHTTQNPITAKLMMVSVVPIVRTRMNFVVLAGEMLYTALTDFLSRW